MEDRPNRDLYLLLLGTPAVVWWLLASEPRPTRGPLPPGSAVAIGRPTGLMFGRNWLERDIPHTEFFRALPEHFQTAFFLTEIWRRWEWEDEYGDLISGREFMRAKQRDKEFQERFKVKESVQSPANDAGKNAEVARERGSEPQASAGSVKRTLSEAPVGLANRTVIRHQVVQRKEMEP